MQAATDYAAKYTAAAMDAYVKYASTRDEQSAAYLLSRANHYEVLAAAAKSQTIEAAPVVKVAAVEAAPVQTAKVPCAHAGTIRRFFVEAAAKGFDVSKAGRDRSRGALGQLLGRRVESRADMTGQDWGRALTALRMGRLAAW